MKRISDSTAQRPPSGRRLTTRAGPDLPSRICQKPRSSSETALSAVTARGARRQSSQLTASLTVMKKTRKRISFPRAVGPRHRTDSKPIRKILGKIKGDATRPTPAQPRPGVRCARRAEWLLLYRGSIPASSLALRGLALHPVGKKGDIHHFLMNVPSHVGATGARSASAGPAGAHSSEGAQPCSTTQRVARWISSVMLFSLSFSLIRVRNVSTVLGLTRIFWAIASVVSP